MTPVVFAALVAKVLDFVKLLTGRDYRPAVTQAAAWAAGVVLIILASHSSATAAIVLPGTSAALGSLDGAGQVLVGLLVASLGSLLIDAKQAIDASDSAAKPPLVPPPGP